MYAIKISYFLVIDPLEDSFLHIQLLRWLKSE